MTNITKIEITATDLEHIMVAIEERRNKLITALIDTKINTSLKDLERLIGFNVAYTKLACCAISTGMFKDVGQTEQELKDQSELLNSALTGMIIFKEILEAKEPRNEAI